MRWMLGCLFRKCTWPEADASSRKIRSRKTEISLYTCHLHLASVATKNGRTVSPYLRFATKPSIESWIIYIFLPWKTMAPFESTIGYVFLPCRRQQKAENNGFYWVMSYIFLPWMKAENNGFYWIKDWLHISTITENEMASIESWICHVFQRERKTKNGFHLFESWIA